MCSIATFCAPIFIAAVGAGSYVPPNDETIPPPKFCIVGGGPGGVQLAYFLKEKGRDFVLLEKAKTAGSFFDFYPRHRRLISINKRFTGRKSCEFNMRHDWNSLIGWDGCAANHTPPVTARSKEMFPDAGVLAEYIRDFAEILKPSVKYEHEVVSVDRLSQARFTVTAKTPTGEVSFDCTAVIMAHGLVPNEPDILGIDNSIGYGDMSVDGEAYLGQKIAILGNGNAAFETSDALSPWASHVFMFGRRHPRLAFETHYVGDARGVNLRTLDQYLLKSLDGVLSAPNILFALAPCASPKDQAIDMAYSEHLWHDMPYSPSENATDDGVCLLVCNEPQDLQSEFECDLDMKQEAYCPIVKGKAITLEVAAFVEKLGGRICGTSGRPTGVLPMSTFKKPHKKLLKALPQLILSLGDATAVPFDKVIRATGWEQNLKVFTENTKPKAITGMRQKYPDINSDFESVTVPGVFYAGTLIHGRDKPFGSSGGFIHGFRYAARWLVMRLEEKYFGVPLEPVLVPANLRAVAAQTFRRVHSTGANYQLFRGFGDCAILKGDDVAYFQDLPLAHCENLHHRVPRLYVFFSYIGERTLAESSARGSSFNLFLMAMKPSKKPLALDKPEMVGMEGLKKIADAAFDHALAEDPHTDFGVFIPDSFERIIDAFLTAARKSDSKSEVNV